MAKSSGANTQKAQGGSKQSEGEGSKQSAGTKSSGKEAASHTKAGEAKGAGGGKKQARKH